MSDVPAVRAWLATAIAVERARTLRHCMVMRVCRCKQSAVIDWVGYQDEQAILWVAFRETGKYVYYDVPPEVFRALCDAQSPGQFFNDHVRDKYRHRRDPARRRFGPNA